jgi:hypothetical protein
MSEQDCIGKIPEHVKFLSVAKLALYLEKKARARIKTLKSGNVNFASLISEVVLRQRMLTTGVKRDEGVRILKHFYGEEYAEKKFDEIKEELRKNGALRALIEVSKGRGETKSKGRPPKIYYLFENSKEELKGLEWLKSLVKYAYMASSLPYADSMIVKAFLQWLETLSEEKRSKVLECLASGVGLSTDKCIENLKWISSGVLEEGNREEIKKILEEVRGKLDEKSYKYLKSLLLWRPKYE